MIEHTRGGETDPVAESLSNLIGAECPSENLSMPLGPGASRYWLPTKSWIRAMSLSTAGDLAGMGAVEAIAAAARPRTQLMRLGAQLIEVFGVDSVLLPDWRQGAGATWITEGQSATADTLNLSTGTASPKSVAVRMGISRKLQLQSAVDIEADLVAELRRATMQAIDSAAYNGLGTAEPLGILNTPDVQTKSFAGATPTAAEISDMVELYCDEEGDLNRAVFIAPPALATALLTVQVGSGGIPLAAATAPRTWHVLGIPLAISSELPAGKLLLLDPSQLTFVAWRAPQLLIDRFSNGKSLSGALDAVVMQDLDLVVRQRRQVVIGG